MPKVTRLGLVGCGRISQAYVEAIRQLPTVEFVAVMDTRADAAQAVAEANCAVAYTDFDAFSRAEIDAAIICCPPAYHREAAVALLGRGVDVLCEKPFATSGADARAMLETSTRTKRTLMMASKFRYADDVIRAKSMIASGTLGDILFYDNCFSGVVNMRDRWNSDARVSGGGVLIDNGTHSVDIVRYLLGPIESVFAFEGKRVAGLDVEDTATVSFRTAERVMGTIRLSWSVQVDSSTYIDVVGTEGALRVGWKESLYKRHGNPDWKAFGAGYDKIAAFRNQVENFVLACRGDEPPRITKEEGLSSVTVVEAAYESLETREWVSVQDQVSAPDIAVAK